MILQLDYKSPGGPPGEDRRAPHFSQVHKSYKLDIWVLSEIWFLLAAGNKMRTTGGPRTMNTPLKSRSTAILGSATIPGRPEEVSRARAFVARTLAAADKTPALDSDAATLLTSELVANAIQHTASGAPDGTVTIVVVDVPDGVLVEVIDDGSDGTPV